MMTHHNDSWQNDCKTKSITTQHLYSQLNKMTLEIITFGTMTPTIMTLSIMPLRITTPIKTTFSKKDAQLNDAGQP
jgi:hypothetical protein